eukprot:TRINITY_DN5983_c0_g1_i1.p1 TRINITY_DN5983_c0_g1~~TRINITY_DN5983_c0_g1_i1.p1  ORF type:complete len:286 (+),score=42.97 TRINITY_DN5983_c0_g1_i1:614-1471(+)
MFGWNGSMAICLFLIPMLVDTPLMLNYFLLFTAVSCTVVGILNILIQEEKAPTPPSSSAEAAKSPEFFNSLFTILKDPSFLILFGSWGCTLGVLQFYFMSAGLVWQPTYSQSETGQIVAVTGATGLFSTYIMGWMVNKYHNYKSALIASSGGAALSLLALGFIYDKSIFPGVVALSGLFGIFALATYPTALDYGTELTFPVPEQFSAATLVIGADIWTVIIAYLVAWEDDNFDNVVSVFTLAGLMGAVTISSVFISANYKRLVYESNQSTNNDNNVDGSTETDTH